MGSDPRNTDGAVGAFGLRVLLIAAVVVVTGTSATAARGTWITASEPMPL